MTWASVSCSPWHFRQLVSCIASPDSFLTFRVGRRLRQALWANRYSQNEVYFPPLIQCGYSPGGLPNTQLLSLGPSRSSI